MSPIRALLWKEGRTAASRIAACSCLALLAGLAHIDWSWSLPFYPSSPFYDSPFTLHTVCALVGILGAILMAMDLVAGERSRGTLPFQSNLPVRTAWLLGVKYAVGATGFLAVLAAYWAGVYLGMPHWGSADFFWSTSWHPYEQPLLAEVLSDVGYGRILLLSFLLYLIFYSGAFLSSTLSNRPFQAAWISLLMVFVGLYLFFTVSRMSDAVSSLRWQVLGNDLHGTILRPAFDPALLLARAAVAFLLAGGVLAWTCRAFRTQGRRGLPWIMSALALICLVVMYGPRLRSSSKTGEYWVQPVGRLPYDAEVVDLAVRDRTAVVLLTSGLSIVDVADWQSPREVGRVETDGWQLRTLAVSASAAYVWGWTEEQDSAGVAAFDLSLPERPRLQTRRLLYPIEAGPTPWLDHTPRLTAWAVRDGYLYAGLLGREFLELRSFDVRSGGAPQPVQALRVEETARHVWNNDWEMHLAGEKAFFTLGHDFVVLDLTDPAAMQELSRASLRRFGHSSRRYEELMESFHLQLSQLPDEVASEMEAHERGLLHRDKDGKPIGNRRYSWISFPPALGPVALAGDKAYVPRFWPRELAVLDISDPRRPVEVGYLRGKSPSQLVKRGKLVHFLTPWGGIRAYSVDQDGTLLTPTRWRRLQLEGGPNRRPPAKALVLVDDHLCAIADSSLAIFRIPRPD